MRKQTVGTIEKGGKCVISFVIETPPGENLNGAFILCCLVWFFFSPSGRQFEKKVIEIQSTDTNEIDEVINKEIG